MNTHMYRSAVVICSLLLLANISLAGIRIDTSSRESRVVLKTGTGNLFGTLTMPSTTRKVPVALIIAGSGPTDRDGNNPYMKNDCLKQLAEKLAERDIGSVRFDKRGIAESKDAAKQEADLRFEDYVNDAEQWINLLRKDDRFNEVVVIGHSEGSLIGMLAGHAAHKFVSIAGAGHSADKILKEQLKSQPKFVQDVSFPIIDTLKEGKLVQDVSPMLNALFRSSVQPYLISWFKYDPQQEIKKLRMPILILQGSNDLQVSVEDAKRLHAANPKSHLVILENVNHVLKPVTGDKQENMRAYNNRQLPIDESLVSNIVSFILPK